MQKIRSSNPPVVAGICNPNKSQARHHRSLKHGSKLKYLNISHGESTTSESEKYISNHS